MTTLIKYLNLIILLLAASTACAETTNCTAITSIPYVISSPGVYCLTGNLSLGRINGRAIFIDADDVVLDLNGWTLEGTGGLATELVGIKAYQRKNLTIRNGTIRGFYIGILLYDILPFTTSQSHLIEDIRADRNTRSGIRVYGSSSIVRRNQVLNTGGSTVNDSVLAIYYGGSGGRILDNDVTGMTASGSNGFANAIFPANGGEIVVEGNRIDSLISSGTGLGRGVRVTNADDVLVVGNRITNADVGISYNPNGSGSTGKYRDNLTSGVTTPYDGGTDAGNNN